jgi:hypothetical protein
MKKVILVSLLLALFYPFLYLIFQLMTPPGFVFSGMVGGDDGTNLAVMSSVNNHLENPWALTEPKNVFLNPNMGSPFLFVPLGYIAKFLGNRFLLIFQLSRFLGAFFFLTATYIFLKEFFGEKRAWRIFLLFCFSFGLGGLLFLRLKSLVPDLPYVGMWRPITYELFEGAGLVPLTILGRHYYTIPLGCGLLGLVLARKQRFVAAGLLLALTFLIYPILGLSFWFIAAIFWFILFDLRRWYKNALLFYTVAVSGVIPWVGLYLWDSTVFKFYAGMPMRTNPLGLLVSILPHLVFLLMAVLTLPRTPNTALRRVSLFFSLWFIVAMSLALLRTALSARFMLILWLPLVTLSYLGMESLVSILKKKVSVDFLVALLVVLTFPSAVFFTTRFLLGTNKMGSLSRLFTAKRVSRSPVFEASSRGNCFGLGRGGDESAVPNR